MKQQTEDLLTLIIRPTLNALNMGGEAAEALMLGTALVESGGYAIRQQGGPALGIWQMEPATHNDIWDTYLSRRHDIGGKVLSAAEVDRPWKDKPPAEMMAYNARYACGMARVHYWRDPEPIPDTVEGMATMWKRVYNTPLGKGTEAKYIEAWANA